MPKTPTNANEKVPPTNTQKILGLMIGAFALSLIGVVGLMAIGAVLRVMGELILLGWNLF